MKNSLYLVVCILLYNCGAGNTSPSPGTSSTTIKTPPLAVEVQVIQPTTLIDRVESNGTLLPFEQTELHPEMAGRVTGLYFKEGTKVKKGSLLMKLYDADLKAQLTKLTVQQATAAKTVERYAQLLAINGISQQDYDLAVLQVNNIKADIELVKANLSKTELRAPFDGKIGLRSISEGAFVNTNTAIATLADVKQLKLEFSVPEKYASLIRPNDPLEFSVEGASGTFTAHVMASEVIITENTRNLSVKALVRANNPALVPGAFAKTKMELGKNDHALLVPSDAVVPQGRKKQVFLYRNGKAMAIEVSTGSRSAGTVEITSGIQQGDTLITSGLLFLKPMADVKISKVNG